jgi:predicted ATPase
LVQFNFTFSSFIAALASEEHPLVIFLDDIHCMWFRCKTIKRGKIEYQHIHLIIIYTTGADVNTLALISTFMAASRTNISYLLLIAAYRDNEVTDSHPLLQTLKEVREKGTLQELHLADLSEEDVVMLIDESFNKNKSKLILVKIIILNLFSFVILFLLDSTYKMDSQELGHLIFKKTQDN